MPFKITTTDVQATVEILMQKKGLVIMRVAGPDAELVAQMLRERYASHVSADFQAVTVDRATSICFYFRELVEEEEPSSRLEVLEQSTKGKLCLSIVRCSHRR